MIPVSIRSFLQNSLHKSPNPRALLQLQTQIFTNTDLHSDDSILSHFLSTTLLSSGLNYVSVVLRHLPRPPSLPLFNLIFRCFSLQPRCGTQLFGLYSLMLHEGVRPDKETLSVLLRSCCRVLDEDAGCIIHCHILKMGFANYVFLATGLLDYYAKAGKLVLARRVFGEMTVRDVVANNAMIAALGNSGFVGDARNLFDEMKEKSSASWNSMISCYSKNGDMRSTLEMFAMNPMKDLISWNAVIDGYCKLGHMEKALEMFEKMGSARNHVTWNTMISGYVHHREFRTALSLFRKMQFENVRPTSITMVCLLSACSHLGALNMGKWIHNYIRYHKVSIDVVLGNALIDMYYKCGRIEAALEVFHGMPIKNLFCWNSVISGLGMHGNGREAIETFYEMKKDKAIVPDDITFVALLSACSHSGLVSEGKVFFSQMKDVYSIEPKIEHFGCMVDLLGRSGFLEEALDIIYNMPMDPNAAVWGSLFRS